MCLMELGIGTALKVLFQMRFVSIAIYYERMATRKQINDTCPFYI